MAPYTELSDGSTSSASAHAVFSVQPAMLDRFLDTFSPSLSSGDEPPLKKLRISPPDSGQSDELIPIKTLEFDLRIPTPEITFANVWERLAASDLTPLPIRWSKQPIHSKNNRSTSLYAWDPRDIDNPIASLIVRWDDDTSEKWCNVILDAQFGLSKKVKDLDSWDVAVRDEGYRVRSRFRRGKTEGSLVLLLEIVWRDGVSYFDLPSKTNVTRAKKTFDAVFANNSPMEPWIPQDFYGNAHVPSSNSWVCSQLHDDLLDCTLYPYQRRTVQFMLDREGAPIPGNTRMTSPSSSTTIFEPHTILDEDEAKISYSSQLDPEGRQIFVSQTIGTVCRSFKATRAVRGGILAEEMGLGKTLEMIALIMLHKPPEDERVGNFAKPFSSATLIVTPNHLLEQWEDELSIHAPSLRVHTFGGYRRDISKLDEKGDNFDVLLCTYDTLARQFWYVNAGRDFTLRNEKKYLPQKNPLLERTWWRVCLDEAQMVDQGVSHAATVAKLIPRVNAWAISGTPFKSHVEDLRGLLLFLGYSPFHDPKIWSRVDKLTFKDIFGKIAIRHSKDRVRNELRLPPQKRIIVTVPFMAMEEQNYATLFRQMFEDCKFGSDGDPLNNEFYGDSQQTIDKMRSWLRRLRQTCLHPHVGTKNRRAIGSGEKPLRTVDEVLDAMIKGHFAHVVNHERTIIETLVQKGHAYAFEKENPERAKKSLLFYQMALDKVTDLVEQCESAQTKSSDDHHEDPARREKIEKGKGKKRIVTSMRQNLRLALELQHTCHFFVATAHFQIKDNEELTVKDSEEFKQLEEKEIFHYEAAKVIRRQLLAESREEAEKFMQRVEELEPHKINIIDMSQSLGGLENIRSMEKYIRIAKILNEQASLLEKWQNRVRTILLQSLIDADKDQEQTGEEYEESTKVQDELYVMFQALRTVVADRQGFLTGRINYLTEHEAKEAIKAAQKDKDTNDASKMLLELLKDWEDLRPKPEHSSVRGVIGEQRSLLTSLEWRRGGLREDRTTQSRVDSEINIVGENLRKLDAMLNAETKNLEALEKQLGIFRDCMNVRLTYYRRLQAISDAVQPFKEEFDEQLDRAHLSTWNYKTTQSESQLSIHQSKLRFLQHLRDHATEEKSRECIICQDTFENGVLTSCGHQYCKDCLKEWFSSHRTCPMCKRKLHSNELQDITYKSQDLRAEEEQQPSSPIRTRSDNALSSSSSTANTSDLHGIRIYSEISQSMLQRIKSIDLPVSYSTKVDSICRTLLYLRETDPGAKSVIFSQFSDFLDTLADAFKQVQINHVSYNSHQGTNKFRRDASIGVFLLDAKSDSSGLNLVNATHVFLCEPLVNTAIELQAIARVHRIGQMRPTTVWMILIADTVEEAVYQLSADRRQQHIAKVNRPRTEVNGTAKTTASVVAASSSSSSSSSSSHAVAAAAAAKAQSSSSSASTATVPPPAAAVVVVADEAVIDAANSLELEAAPIHNLLAKGSKGGGEVVNTDDLWTCLFRKPRNDRSGSGELIVAKTDLQRILRAEAAEERGLLNGG